MGGVSNKLPRAQRRGSLSIGTVLGVRCLSRMGQPDATLPALRLLRLRSPSTFPRCLSVRRGSTTDRI